MSIYVGLGGWGDHDSLYPKGMKAQDKLSRYAKHFPIVEIDSTFYAIQSPERMQRWLEDTPDDFKFIVKAYQGMTGHQRGNNGQASKKEEMYAAFLQMLEPLIQANRLLAVLFQYPPWFDCMTKHVMVLRSTKKIMGDIPCIIEFRNQSWYKDAMREKTLAFIRQEGWLHTVCDEPQAGEGSIPIVLEATSSEFTLVRLHGRNAAGWNDTGDEKWREVRYLYDYQPDELKEWSQYVLELQKQSKVVAVIFNNNSGGHAAGNAKQFMDLLGQKRPDGKSPFEGMPDEVEQLELF